MTYSFMLKQVFLTFFFISFVLALYTIIPSAAHAQQPPATACANLTYNLHIGVSDATTGNEVSELQRSLRVTGDFTYPEITGYFGPATEQAVQRWQARNGIVSFGLPDTTGYGLVGPRTRAAMRCDMDSGSESGETGIFIISPTRNTTISHEQHMQIAWWSSTEAPDGAKVRLEVWPVGTIPTESNNEAGIASGASALSPTGTYDWTIPAEDAPEIADAGFRSRLPAGGYFIVARLYSGNECWGFCASSSEDRTVHATAQSAPFTVGEIDEPPQPQPQPQPPSPVVPSGDDPDGQGESVVCPAVCVPLYEIQGGSCVYNSCGSGCGPNDDTTFKTLQQCNREILQDHADTIERDGTEEGVFGVGNRVTNPGVRLSVREQASIAADRVDIQSAGSSGTIISGPVAADGYRWWKIQWDNGVTGWSVQAFLSVRSAGTAATGDITDKPIIIKDTNNDEKPETSVFGSGAFVIEPGPRSRVTNIASRLNVRARPSIAGERVGTRSNGASGTAITGPVLADGHSWWEIRWDNGMSGWSAEEFLSFSAAQTTNGLSIGDRITGTTGRYEVYIEPILINPQSLDFVTSLGIQAVGSSGVILNDPDTMSDGNTWWQIRWSNGVTGWSVVDTPLAFSGQDGGGTHDGTTVTESITLADRVTNPTARVKIYKEPFLINAQSLDFVTPIAVQPAGAEGTILGSPVAMDDGNRWLQVHWDSGITGWSLQDNLLKF